MSLWGKIRKAAVKAIVKAAKAVAGFGKEVGSVLREVLHRALGFLDFLGSLLGIRPEKKLRLRIVILRDDQGTPLTTEQQLEPVIAETKRIFKEQVQTKVVAAGGDMVKTVKAASPAAALDVGCGTGAWGADFGEAGYYFGERVAGTENLYASPVTVFIVRSIADKGGCSLGPLTDYVTVEVSALADTGGHASRIVAHEIGHSCGLPHSGHKKNLMHRSAEGDGLRRWQEATFRSSRHVTFI